MRRNRRSYKTLLTSLTFVTLLTNVNVNNVYATEENWLSEVVTEEVIEQLPPPVEEISEKTSKQANSTKVQSEKKSDESIFSSGNHGINWRLTTDGVLFLGQGTLKQMEGQYGNSYPWTQTGGAIKKIVIEGNIVLPDKPKLFMRMGNLQSIDNIHYLDTSNVSDMSYMFYYTPQLKELDLSNWDTSKVINMDSMFAESSVSSIKLENWDVSRVESMNNMFYNATNLESINLEKWDVSNVRSMSGMFSTIFSSNSNLANLEISTWDVSNVTNMSIMFSYAKSLKSLNIQNWDVSNVKNMSGMFSNARSLENLDLSNWDVSHVENMNYMFQRTYQLTNLDLSGWDVSKVLKMSYMFEGSSFYPPIKVLNLSDWKLSGMTDIDNMFTASSSVDIRYVYELDLSNWNTDKLYSYDFISKLPVYTTLKLKNWKEDSNLEEALDILSKKNSNLNIIRYDHLNPPNTTDENGWNIENNNWVYYKGNKKLTDWQYINNYWYFMDASGYMQTGWTKVGSAWYYMNSDGAMQTGWAKVDGTWYYMNSDGAMQTSWAKVDSTWYYMNSDGVMQTGWAKVDGTWYYMNSSGAMQIGWLKIGQNWYFLNNDGSMQLKNTIINGTWYQFDSSGKML